MRILARCFGISVLIMTASSAVLAQSGGGVVGGIVGGAGRTVGGVVGGAGNAVTGVGGTVGGIGRSLGGAGGPLGGLAGPVGGVATTINGVGGGISGVGGGIGSTMVGGRFVDSFGGGNGSAQSPISIDRSEVEREIDSNLNELGYSLWAHKVPPATLLDLRKLRLQELVKSSGGYLEFDGAGNPTVRGRLLVVNPGRRELAAVRKAGFTAIASENDPVLGAVVVVLRAPPGLATPAAMALLRKTSPKLYVEFDHVFEPAGGTLAVSSVAVASNATAADRRVLIGMIDGGVGQNPALESATIEQKGFAGPPQATGHGTAIASLIVGANGKFRGAAPDAALMVADVYGGNPAAGTALGIAKAMSWLIANRTQVINVSLVGPRNRLVERAIAAAHARGIKVVAAVGNDGPAAPPLYPASQPGVIAVTGVDATSRALAEAGKAGHLDYSAPGADMAAALPGKGYANVRGTSFAAPFVSARLALTGSTARLDAEASKKGFGRIGRGIVCGPCRVAPKKVGAK